MRDYLRDPIGGWGQKFIDTLGILFVIVGLGIAISHAYDNPSQLAVPFLLAGIACPLYAVRIYAEGILVDLEELYKIAKERQERDDER